MGEVARLVWEAEGADILPVGSGGAVGVLGRWLRGGDAERAEDALLASYHLRDKDILELVPAIAGWVGVGPVSAHVRRLLGMVPVKELRPVLVPVLAARLRGEPDPHSALRRACAGLLEHLGLEDQTRLLTDPDFHGSRTPRPKLPENPATTCPDRPTRRPAAGSPPMERPGRPTRRRSRRPRDGPPTSCGGRPRRPRPWRGTPTSSP